MRKENLDKKLELEKKLGLDNRHEIVVPNDAIALDEDGNEVKTYRKEYFTLREQYQLKNSADSILAAIQAKIDIIEKAGVEVNSIKIEDNLI